MAGVPGRHTGRSCFEPPRRARPWVVLDPFVELGQAPAAPAAEWAAVRCDGGKAYGWGEHGETVARGLTLYVRRLTTPPSSNLSTALYIQASNDALRGIQAEFGEDADGPLIPIDGYEFSAKAFIESAVEGVVVISLVFRLRRYHTRAYYLVYNAVDMSLALIPGVPDPCPVSSTLTPLTVPRDGGGYELLLLASKLEPASDEYSARTHEEILCVWTPEAKPPEEPAGDGAGGMGPWRTKGRRLQFPKEVDEAFAAEVMFSFQGKAFFVDLSQGLVHCDLPTADNSFEGFGFTPLPAQVPDPRRNKFKLEDMGPINHERTMRPVGRSIRFACIERSDLSSGQQYGDAKITVWTLKGLGTKQWVKDREFLARELWNLKEFRRRKLPPMEPKCPVLMPDGTLCLLLPNKRLRMEDPMEDYICNIDLSGRHISILWSGHLSNYRYTEPAMLPPDFFSTNVHPRLAGKS
ncbi:hypothetical protein ACP70R_024384 [Stipagrostis hirtigluma subsp. patula]